MFWITNLIKIVKLEIRSNSNSLTKLELGLDPLINEKNEIPKSINNVNGIVKNKIATRIKLPIIQLKKLICDITINNEPMMKELIAKINNKAKANISSTGPISFSFSVVINNLTKLIDNKVCLV